MTFRQPVLNLAPISIREWLPLLVLTLACSTLFSLPYLLGHWLTPPDNYYTGLLINVEDGSYLSAIEQGRNGLWTYRILFTTEPHTPVFIQGFYLALGHLARGLGLSAVSAWHLGLWLANNFLFIILYRFISLFLVTIRQRRVAFLLAIFGSGFDWFNFPHAWEQLNALEAIPIDLRMPEAHLFFSSLTYPHFSVGVALILCLFWFMLQALSSASNRQRWAWAFLTGVANLGIGIVYPFLIYLTAAVLALFYLYLVWRERRILWQEGFMLALAFVLPFPLLLYYLRAINSSPVYELWNAQAVTYSPHPLHYLLAYAPYLLLALPGLKRRHEQALSWTFLWIWVGTAAVLLYTPVNPQRRFVEGLQVPLTILATFGLFHSLLPALLRSQWATTLLKRPRYSPAGLERFVIYLTILTAGLINIYIYTSTLMTLGRLQPYPIFRPQDELQAMTWLKDNSNLNDTVFSAYWTGSLIPSTSGNRVFVGQRYETNNFLEKQLDTQKFFDTVTNDQWRVSLLREYDIDYLFFGQAEKELGNFQPMQAPYLDLVYENESVALYRVLLDTP